MGLHGSAKTQVALLGKHILWSWSSRGEDKKHHMFFLSYYPKYSRGFQGTRAAIALVDWRIRNTPCSWLRILLQIFSRFPRHKGGNCSRGLVRASAIGS